MGKNKGTIYANSDANNKSHSITLKLPQRNGKEIVCTGYIAQDTNNFMAGTCGDKENGSAWYAVRKGGLSPSSNKPPAKSFSSFEDRISGNYYEKIKKESGKITFQVPKKLFPELPTSNKDLYKWLVSHNNALLSLTNAVLNKNDQHRFRSVEKNKCDNDLFCEIAFKQHTIYCAINGC